MKIDWDKELKSENAYLDRYTEAIDITEQEYQKLTSYKRRKTFLQKIVFEYDKKVKFKLSVGLDGHDSYGFGTMEFEYMNYVKLMLEQLEELIEHKPIEPSITSKGRYQALLRYCDDKPIKESEGKLYQYYRDWVNYFVHNKPIQKISEKTVKKYIKALPIERITKLTGKQKR